MTVNASVGLFSYYYRQGNPTQYLRGLAGENMTSQVSSLDTNALIEKTTSPTYTNGTALSWITNTYENFTAVITSGLEFLNFFTGSFVGDFLGNIGLPPQITVVIYVPLGLYTAYLVIVLLTNRGH